MFLNLIQKLYLTRRPSSKRELSREERGSEKGNETEKRGDLLTDRKRHVDCKYGRFSSQITKPINIMLRLTRTPISREWSGGIYDNRPEGHVCTIQSSLR